MPTQFSPSREFVTDGRLRLFAMYLDYPASIRARWANSTMSQIAGDNWIISTEMWRIDSLETNPAIAKMVTEEATKADVIVVVASSLDYRHHQLTRWLESLGKLNTLRQTTGLLIGLFGDEQNQKSELGWTVYQLLNCASTMNCDFIWHWMDADAMKDYGWLTENLQPFLTRKRHETEKALLFEPQLIAV